MQRKKAYLPLVKPPQPRDPPLSPRNENTRFGNFYLSPSEYLKLMEGTASYESLPPALCALCRQEMEEALAEGK